MSDVDEAREREAAARVRWRLAIRLHRVGIIALCRLEAARAAWELAAIRVRRAEGGEQDGS